MMIDSMSFEMVFFCKDVVTRREPSGAQASRGRSQALRCYGTTTDWPRQPRTSYHHGPRGETH